MTAILVILMVVSIFAIDALKLYIKRRRGETPVPEAIPAFSAVRFPKGLFLGENHAWARLTELGEMKVGLDELLTQALGYVDEVEVAPAGTQVRKGDHLATITRLGHKVEVTSPLDGTVVAVNDNVINEPYGVHQDPYGRGWLATVWPTEHTEALRDLKVGDRASAWLGHEIQRPPARAPNWSAPWRPTVPIPSSARPAAWTRPAGRRSRRNSHGFRNTDGGGLEKREARKGLPSHILASISTKSGFDGAPRLHVFVHRLVIHTLQCSETSYPMMASTPYLRPTV